MFLITNPCPGHQWEAMITPNRAAGYCNTVGTVCVDIKSLCMHSYIIINSYSYSYSHSYSHSYFQSYFQSYIHTYNKQHDTTKCHNRMRYLQKPSTLKS